MPSPNAAAKVSVSKPLDKAEFGQKLAKRKSQEFSAKVARWNSSGGGIAPDQKDDEVIVVVEEGSTTGDTPAVVVMEPTANQDSHDDKENHREALKIVAVDLTTPERTSTAKKTTREVDVNRKAWVRRKSKTQADKIIETDQLEPDVKHAGTPKKRVVSDGHWRRDRVAKAETPEQEKPIPTPKPLIIRSSVASVGLKLPVSIGNVIEERETRPARRRHKRRSASRSPPRSRSPSQDRTEPREDTPDYESSGTRIYVKRRTPSRQIGSRPVSRDLKSSDNIPSGSPQDKQPARDRHVASTPPSAAVERYMRLLVPTQEQLSPKEPTKAPSEIIPRRHRSNRRSPRVSNERDHSDANSEEDKPKEPTPPRLPTVYGNRIQGWLATTSDPFGSPDITPEPLRPRIKKRQPDTLDESSSQHKEHHSGRGLPSEQNLERSPRTPTLKRRGARRTATSPIKDKSSREGSPRTDELANDLSSYLGKTEQSAVQPVSVSAKRIPSTGRELSTIVSVETFNSLLEPVDHHKFLTEGSVLSRASDGDERRSGGGLQRRLTKHSDLISVLSAQRAASKSIRARESVKSARKHGEPSVGDIMNELTTDELKYQRELRTLVDGVIPVLLQYVLSNTHTVKSSGLLGQKAIDTQLVTQPIVDMGVALERLKNKHKHIPMHDAQELTSWAESAKAVYTGYVAVWRLGFHDVVVNLAPAEGADKQSPSRWDSGLPRNNKDELVGGDGERVDVAYLLKRPLVRLKHLAKTFEAIDQFEPSQAAKDMAAEFHEMVQQARSRANEEKARLEDEAAAAIDPTRARESRTLAPIAGVRIDATRCVRARDFFDIDFRHSNGQQINCRVELIMRDDAPGRGEAGDVLFCELSTTGRWLLFPPVHLTMISARRGRRAGQMVVMLRGYRNDGSEWREVMALDAEDEESVEEWLGMLPSSPVPRNLAAKSSFDLKRHPTMSGALPEPSESDLERLPSVREMQVPLGEHYAEPTERWDASEVNSDAGSYSRTTLRRTKMARHRSQPAEAIAEEPYAYDVQGYKDERSRRRGRPMSEHYDTTAYSSKYQAESRKSTRDDYSVWLPSSRQPSQESSAEEDVEPLPRRPTIRRRTSSVPSLEFPTVNKLRKKSQSQELERPHSSREHGAREDALGFSPEEPSSTPSKLQKQRSTPLEASRSIATPQSKSQAASSGLRASIIPSLTPAFLKRHRRSSSPLKHEYEPSSASSLSDSEVSGVQHDDNYTSDSSAEHVPDDQISTLGELKSFPTHGGYRQMKQVTPPESLYAPSDPSLAPSQSASQAPYRTVPPPEMRAATTVASIFAWAESGSWDSLHPEDCCVVITPGLIEAFDSTQALAAPAENSEEAMQSPSTRGVKPLVALELTPLVPLRRGTALDISIRSPPTANSLYRTGNNIMFRSRNAEECEALYHMLNRARIDNPTYLALQRARGPMAQSNWGEVMEQRNASRLTSNSWFGLAPKKSSTYRSNSINRPRSVAATESSVGTMQTAFSALRRFSGSNKIFNIGRSTITSRQGSRSTYSDSLDSGIAAPAQIDPSLGTPLGLTNMKIRLYVRETASRWRDMGAARLTILIPPRRDPSIPANPMQTGREKRVLISGKQQGQILVDATLGEAAFERIARTGIAMSVWEENIDGLVARTGGVLAAKTKVYMIQMKSDREAAYTFGLVGKLRY